jgi:hypothetical protein
MATALAFPLIAIPKIAAKRRTRTGCLMASAARSFVVTEGSLLVQVPTDSGLADRLRAIVRRPMRTSTCPKFSASAELGQGMRIRFLTKETWNVRPTRWSSNA